MEYSIADRCTIYFEVDGPWRAMVLPSSEHEGKQLKKRYVVFKDNGTIQELKGFEIKRRGELKLIKEFQSQIFGAFLAGDNLKESYAAAAAVADHYLDILDTKGESMDDGELLAMISESRNMSKSLDEYGAQRSAAITTAKRLSEFLDNSSVRGAGVSCRFVIAKKPETASVSDRAIPADLFAAPPAVQQRFVRKWCSDNGLVDCSFRAIVDWDYYRQRLTNQILKLICLPSYFQGLQNPVPRVAYPDWLLRRMKSTKDAGVQMNLQSLFASIREKNQLDGADSSLGLGDNNEVMEAVGDENNNQSESNITGDIEDIVVTKTVTQSSPKKKSGKITSMLVKRSRETYEEGATETIEDVLGKAPDEKTDPKGWLAWQKNKWRIQREQRKRRKAELGENAHLQRALTSQKATGLQSFLNKKNLSLLYKQWQILQVSETGDAGVLRHASFNFSRLSLHA
jgi:DNA polymerase epsilon subunit 1